MTFDDISKKQIDVLTEWATVENPAECFAHVKELENGKTRFTEKPGSEAYIQTDSMTVVELDNWA